jgi:glucokinase
VIGASKVIGIGMGVPGPMSSREGVIYEAPNLPGWVNVPVRKLLEERLELPLALNNDANAAAYGEFWAGAGRDVGTMILFTLGTGVGGGIILNGELYSGPDDTAGELGHMVVDVNGPICNCGNQGCLEAFASATAVKRMLRDALQQGRSTRIVIPQDDEEEFGAKLVYDAAVMDDELAIEIFRKVGFYLGIGAANMINIFNPEMIVYSGAMSGAGDFIFKPLREIAFANSFRKPGSRVIIDVAKLGPDAGIIGAAGLALKRLLP